MARGYKTRHLVALALRGAVWRWQRRWQTPCHDYSSIYHAASLTRARAAWLQMFRETGRRSLKNLGFRCRCRFSLRACRKKKQTKKKRKSRLVCFHFNVTTGPALLWAAALSFFWHLWSASGLKLWQEAGPERHFKVWLSLPFPGVSVLSPKNAGWLPEEVRSVPIDQRGLWNKRRQRPAENQVMTRHVRCWGNLNRSQTNSEFSELLCRVSYPSMETSGTMCPPSTDSTAISTDPTATCIWQGMSQTSGLGSSGSTSSHVCSAGVSWGQRGRERGI